MRRPPIRRLSVYAIELAHTFRQIAVRRFNHQVVVVRHQASGMVDPIEALHYFSQRAKVHNAIFVAFKKRFSTIARVVT